MKKIRIAFVSRHKLLPVQRAELLQKFSNYDIEIIEIRMLIPNAQILHNELRRRQIDFAILVAPQTVIQRYLEISDKPLIYVKMIPLHYCNKCSDYNPDTDILSPARYTPNGKKFQHYRHSHFEFLHEIKLVTSPLNTETIRQVLRGEKSE